MEDDAARNGADPEGMSLEQMADESQGEMFPEGSVDGDGLSLKSLVKAKHAVTHEISMRSASIPSPAGGLMDPERERRFMVTCEVEQYVPKPQRAGEPGAKRVTGWKIVQHLRPVHVAHGEQFYSREQVLRILEEVGIPRDSDKVAEMLGEAEPAGV